MPAGVSVKVSGKKNLSLDGARAARQAPRFGPRRERRTRAKVLAGQGLQRRSRTLALKVPCTPLKRPRHRLNNEGRDEGAFTRREKAYVRSG